MSNENIIADPPRRITRAVFIGINYVGTRNELQGCVSDVNKKFARARMFYTPTNENTRVLTDDVRNLSPELSQITLPSQPTKANMMDALKWLVSDSHPGDLLFLHYSGHGSQQKDKSGDEQDGKDECICPIDMDTNGMIVDDEIKAIVNQVPEGVYCLMEMDCCHSSSSADLMECVTAVAAPTINYQLPKPPQVPQLPQMPQYIKPQLPQLPYGKPTQPPKIIMIGGIPYYATPTNPMFVKRDFREYPCLVFKYFHDPSIASKDSDLPSVSQRSVQFRPMWNNIVNGFCVENGVRSYEEPSTTSRHPSVRFYFDEETCLTFYIPEDVQILDKFLVDRNNVRNTVVERSRGLFSSLQAHTMAQLKQYVSSVNDMIHSSIASAARSIRDVAVNNKTYSIKTDTKHTPTKGVVVVWSGCKDEQTSSDSNIAGTPVGAMTHYHLQASSDNTRMRNIDVLCGERDLLNQNRYDQVPQLSFGHSGKRLMEAPYPLHICRASPLRDE